MPTERFEILVVDDNPADRFLYRLAMRADSCDSLYAREADTGKSGIEACRNHLPDCIVLDYSLPDMDGLDFMATLKKEYGDLPCAVVMLTGIQDERIAVRAMKSGATDYIPKNGKISEGLEHSITGAIEKFRMRRQLQEHRAALEVSERKYRALMEGTPHLVWVADGDGAILYANGRWLDFTGQAALTPGQTSINEVLFSEDHNQYWDAWHRAIGTNAEFEVEARLRRGTDGASKWHLIRVVPIQDFPNAGAKWLGTCTDIENNKQAERAIRQTQKWESIGLLAGGIAHDFNNLLVGILGGASYIREALPSEHPLQPIVEGIVRSGERAAQLTRQMLAYAGKGPFLTQPVNLSAVVRETCDLIRSSIPPNVHLNLEMAGALPTVETDASQIQHVIANLVINAAEAVPENRSGAVVVRTFAQYMTEPPVSAGSTVPVESPKTWVVLEVTDDGAGMNEETRNRIFDPFFTTKFPGRGLGLAAVQGILRSTRGDIAVESSPGAGSTFRVFLPPSEVVERREAPESPDRLELRQNPTPAILVIDDEEIVRHVARLALERTGYRVLVADSGAAGLKALERNRESISMVLLDTSMADMTGKEVLTKIRAAGNSVPVVVCSGFSEPEVQQSFNGCPFDGFVQKPFTSKDLAQRVTQLLRGRRQ